MSTDIDSAGAYPCGHPRTSANTKMKSGGSRGGKIRRCRTCVNASKLNAWRRQAPKREMARREHAAAALEWCFWEAMTRCVLDDDVPLNLVPRDESDTGPGIALPNPIPPQFWQYMAEAHSELHAAAGA